MDTQLRDDVLCRFLSRSVLAAAHRDPDAFACNAVACLYRAALRLCGADQLLGKSDYRGICLRHDDRPCEARRLSHAELARRGLGCSGAWLVRGQRGDFRARLQSGILLGLPAAAMVAGGGLCTTDMLSRNWLARSLILVGDASYALCLVHPLAALAPIRPLGGSYRPPRVLISTLPLYMPPASRRRS